MASFWGVGQKMAESRPTALVPGGAKSSREAALLDETVHFIRRHCAFSLPGTPLVVALWALGTYALDAFDAFPFMAVTSPEPESGKTRLLEILECIACAAERYSSTTAASIFRMIAARRPTLLIDEAQVLTRGRSWDHLHEILNAGHRRGANVVRVERGVPVRFPTYSAKALACIGRFSDVIATRSIEIRMQRRLPHEKVEPLFLETAQSETERLRRSLASWVEANLRRVRAAYLAWLRDYARYAAEWEVPALTDREAENWGPLAAVCLAVNPGLMEEFGEAARTLLAVKKRSGTVSEGVQLLADIQSVFAGATDAHFLKTMDLLRSLHAMEESGWGQYRGVKPLTPEALASLLRPFDIRPRHVHARPAPTIRGYERADFADAWARYLGPDHTDESRARA